MHIWGCPSEVSIYNSQEKKLDSRTISGYFIGYAERSKGYRFYCPCHITRIVGSRNAKFPKNDLINRSDQLRDLGFKIDYIESQPSTSSKILVIIHTPQVQRDDKQKMIDIPQLVADNPVEHQIPENNEQPAEQHDPQENIDASLRRSTRLRK